MTENTQSIKVACFTNLLQHGLDQQLCSKCIRVQHRSVISFSVQSPLDWFNGNMQEQSWSLLRMLNKNKAPFSCHLCHQDPAVCNAHIKFHPQNHPAQETG